MLSISASKGISIFHMRKSDLASIVELAEFAEVLVSTVAMKLSISSTMRFDPKSLGNSVCESSFEFYCSRRTIRRAG